VNKAQLAAEALNAYLIRIRAIMNPTIAQKQEFRLRLAGLNKRIIGALRSDGPGVNWDNVPVARDWFTQNINTIAA
jgi:hypothetical protein